MQGNGSDLRILSLEDVAYDAELMERELRKAGIQYNLQRVETRQQFLSALDEFKPDIILADFSLPQFSALEALRLLKEQQRNVPVILVTGSHSEEVAVECMKEGAEDYILKASLTRLPTALQSTIRKKEFERTKEQAEDALRQSEEQYRLITENTRDLICLLDNEDRFVYVSPSFDLVLGYRAVDLVGTPFFDLIHPDDAAMAQKALAQARRQRQQRTAEIRYRDRTGHWQLYEAAANLPSSADDGKPARVVIVSRDVSERKRAEHEIQHLAAFPRFNPNPVLAFSADAALTYFNDAAQAMAESFGKEHPRDILPPNTAEVVARCLRARQNHIRLDTVTGGRTISWTFYPIHPTHSVHCYAEDITERLSLEQQLRRSQKMESIGQLAAGIAHDFNNILTIVQGHSSMLLHGAEASKEQRDAALEQICVAAERGANLTRQLLLFSRKQLAQRRVMNLNSVVQEVAKMLGVLLGEQVRLDLHLDPELPAINADEGMMEQILMNLAVNSRDAMPRGGTITISTFPRHVDERYARAQRDAHPGHFVCLVVRDTGTGMSPDTLSHVFEPFFTTKEVGKGTGLGLATIYGIVKQHQGWIEVDTLEGEGTTFRIFFPATTEQPEPAAARVHAPELPHGSETILVVEDEEPLRHLVVSILMHAGYQVHQAGNGLQALDLWRERRDEIDLVLTDIMMPEGMSGRDLAERILADAPDMKVLYTSGYPVEVVGPELLRDSAVCFLQKPYQPAALAEAVRRCLDSTRERSRSKLAEVH